MRKKGCKAEKGGVIREEKEEGERGGKGRGTEVHVQEDFQVFVLF
jgi:hypothetical protein